MNKTKRKLPITDVIGILLVIVALVSAGGLCYVASEYTKIADTLVSAEVDISSFYIVRNNLTGEVFINVMVTLNNPSTLDIKIYRVEYQTYVDRDTSTITSFDRYIGSGSTNDNNGTVLGGTVREVPISHVLMPDTLYEERLNYALDGDDKLYAHISGILWFRISDYPDVESKAAFGFFNEVVIRYV
jgi:hypothetical protein